MSLGGTSFESAEAGDESDWEYEYHDTETEVREHHSPCICSRLTRSMYGHSRST